MFGTFDGILVTKEFFRFFDYNSSSIYVNNKSITVDCRFGKSFVNNVVDPCDMSKVNAEIIDIEGYGMVIRATKPIDADGEIFISFGRCFWIYYFTRFSDLSPEQQLLQKRANTCYNIEDELVKRILELKNIYLQFTNFKK